MPVSEAVRWAAERGGNYDELFAHAEAAGRIVRAPNSVQLESCWWATAELVDQIQAVTAANATEPDQSLLTEPIVQIRSVHEGVNDTREVVFADGTNAYFKSFSGLDMDCASDYGHDSAQQPIHEVAASLCARTMGPPWSSLVPGCVLRVVDGELGSLLRGVSGEEAAMWDADIDQRQMAGFFDALIGNVDRNPGNWKVDDHQVRLIDHGFAFSNPGEYVNFTTLQAQRSSWDAALTEPERNVLQRLLDGDDRSLASVLQPDRYLSLRARADFMLREGRIPPDWERHSD